MRTLSYRAAMLLLANIGVNKTVSPNNYFIGTENCLCEIMPGSYDVQSVHIGRRSTSQELGSLLCAAKEFSHFNNFDFPALSAEDEN